MASLYFLLLCRECWEDSDQEAYACPDKQGLERAEAGLEWISGKRLATDGAACAEVKLCSSLSDVEMEASLDDSSKIHEGGIGCGGSICVDFDLFKIFLMICLCLFSF